MRGALSESIERAAAAALAMTLAGISYWLNFKHFIVIASVTTTTYDNYGVFVLAWTLVALAFTYSRSFAPVYMVFTAALIAHAYFLLFIECYFMSIGVTKTFGALITLAVANAIALLRRMAWRDVAMLNAAVAAAVLPLAMQEAINYTTFPSR